MRRKEIDIALSREVKTVARAAAKGPVLLNEGLLAVGALKSIHRQILPRRKDATESVLTPGPFHVDAISTESHYSWLILAPTCWYISAVKSFLT
jgi:hypothetical protein